MAKSLQDILLSREGLNLLGMIQQASSLHSSDWRWPHFSRTELACRCRGRFCRASYVHDPDFLDALERMRSELGRAMVITSGHRCAQWNALVGGAPHSMHKQIAVDVSLAGHDRRAVLAEAEWAGFTGIGLARTFIHLDRRARPARWFYSGSRALWTT